MPLIILGIGSFAIAALSLTKDLVKDVEQSGDEISNIMLTTTALVIAGAGIYLMATDKLKFSVK